MMMKRLLRYPMLATILALSVAIVSDTASARGQMVRAVLFFSPTCGHCHLVINEYLPVLFGNHGGVPRLVFDTTVPEAQRDAYLFTNGRLEILVVNVAQPKGRALYGASTVSHNVPPVRSGVPRLVIGDTVLVGSDEIPERTDELVQQAMAGGGLGWPSVAGLEEIVAFASTPPVQATVEQQDPATREPPEPEDTAAMRPEPRPSAVSETVARSAAAPEPQPAPVEDSAAVAPTPAADTTVGVAGGERATPEPQFARSESSGRAGDALEMVQADSGEAQVAGADRLVAEQPGDSTADASTVFEVIPEHAPTMLENLRRDPVGNAVSVIVLVAMIACVAALPVVSRFHPRTWELGLVVPIVTLVGAVVAGYLTFIEASGATAVCGPVGDCNAVQQSDYAVLFGVIPVGALGLAGYFAITAAWFVSRLSSGIASDWAKVSMLVVSAVGTLFSVYLTFLEPFVIGATCAWCLTSSVLLTVLMLLSARSGREAWGRLRGAVVGVKS
jgi:uncharacterized membrane protein